MFGFVGPNGAGKTTTMRIIIGVLEPDAGEVRWNGEPLSFGVRSRFGYMPEERGLYPKMRVKRQLSYLAALHGLTDSDAAADRWIDRLGLTERAEDRVEELSLGNQQRVQLAAALVHEPELLVLDEPFSGLDPPGTATMERIVRDQAAQGRAVVFSSHQLDLVESLCDDVVIIDRGRDVLAGRLDELRDRSEHRHVTIGFAGEPAAMPDMPEPERAGPGELHWVLSAGDDPEQLLHSARRAGEVRRFAFEPPRLSELFQEATGR
jgi:ABC-2 type transport system ATP-binding protein